MELFGANKKIKERTYWLMRCVLVYENYFVPEEVFRNNSNIGEYIG